MSLVASDKRRTIRDVRAAKGGAPIVCLTAHSAPMARILDAHVDLLLVGDSLGMAVYGFSSTLPVTLDMMIAHGAAVVRGSKRALVVIDLPFATYQESPEQAFRNAARVMVETGAQAVKLEGGTEMAPTIRFLTQRGIPVMAHVGLLPQSVNAQGGYRTQGRAAEAAAAIVADASAVAEAGAFSVVIEGTMESVARRISGELAIPTIGIGASVACDGQILVTDDLTGLFQDFTPRFVKRYADLAGILDAAVAAYAEDVRERRFPGPEHVV
ncbi:3-methyl-2-oxobutanoate hydroxymethyltransferase [Siculibacillus lacustris]|uniref:3-methyl-2-oxobutanoate hydroxymethyltransferase n=1 Tax=Siculibacillus lacustris TaxID=1549641 RepID=A0A4V2KT66_9HYPH|nr:3-methyl-2-oxobutanoate hydroxymethyltransferase [Siculibacillus lacustris]TBW35956.1 3-methyl-2-oxobutanoate hydroxymethyltransferase [Siculibacillus lacustris]